MSPEIVSVPLSEKAVLWAMFQVYAAELAPMVSLQPVDGVYPYTHFDLYWQEDQRWPFWAVLDGERIGFALVRLAPEMGAMQIAEFYIAAEHRRGGYGSAFASGLLNRFPGRWKIRQIAANARATAFWREVATPFGYTEETFAMHGIDRVEQTLTV
ncbi:MAG: GNAT family N-acetyltransferase [Rhizomicrobium sp.]